MTQTPQKGILKLSGLLAAGMIPQADERVVDRMAQLTPTQQIVAEASQVPATGCNVQAETLSSEDQVVAIALDLIDRSPYQPRIKIDEAALEALTSSIEAGKLIEPIILRAKSDGRYELIAGERRWMAHQALKCATIRALLLEVDDRQAAILAGTDNTAREDLYDYELGKYFYMLLQNGFVRNVAEIVRNSTISRAQVDRCLDYMKLPTYILEMLDEKPDLFGATTAEIMAQHCSEGRAEIVTRAAQMIRDGSTEQQAISWITRNSEAQARGAKPPKESTPIEIGGQAIGQARVERSKLVITCAKGTKPSELLQSIVAALQVTG